ncbi:MAG: efflux RND transporter periplasmic adaptor subunit [Pseudomonadales bacterium]|nr:efflux RND transporter periplasmic adaptor subunit [Pseudomonadales bacterium]
MRALTLKPVLLTATLLFGQVLWAQNQIALTDADIRLLELEFAPLQSTGQQAGTGLPARVIASPEQVSQAISRYEGTIERWYQATGAMLDEGSVIASLYSPQILALQQQFLEQDTVTASLRQQLQRDRQLLANGVISEQRLQISEAGLRRAELALEAGRAQLRSAGLEASDITDLLNGEHSLGIGYIRAPVAGELIHRHYRTGEHVMANAVLASLGNDESQWLSVQLPSRLLPLLTEASYLSIAATGERLSLRQRDFSIDAESQTVELLAEFDQPVNRPVGQLLTVMLHPGRDTIYLPSSAVVHEAGETLVYVRTAQGVEIRALELLAIGDGYQATSGVRVGEQVLVRGAALVKGMQLGLGSDE